MAIIPRSYKEFQWAKAYVANLLTSCSNCSMDFSDENTHTPEGWVNTQQIGVCEDCHEDFLDNMYGDPT